MLAPIILAVALLASDAPTNSGLPVEWHGRWVGTLKITPVDGKEQETRMELTIEPLKDSKNLRWRITCGEGKKAQSAITNFSHRRSRTTSLSTRRTVSRSTRSSSGESCTASSRSAAR